MVKMELSDTLIEVENEYKKADTNYFYFYRKIIKAELKHSNLNFKDLTDTQIRSLVRHLEDTLDRYKLETENTIKSMYISTKSKQHKMFTRTYNGDAGFFIYISAHYFKHRECICYFSEHDYFRIAPDMSGNNVNWIFEAIELWLTEQTNDRYSYVTDSLHEEK